MKTGNIYLMMIITIGLLLSVNGIYALFSGGDGTSENPYLVETAEDLDEVRNYPDDYFRQIADIDLSNYTSGEGWEPIDDFSGTYYGSGFTITNLVIDRPHEDNVGLFGSTEEATLSGIRLIDISIIGKDNVGSIVGYSVNSGIYKSSVTGSVKGRHAVGGLTGKVVESSIAECYSPADVEGSENSGGLIGESLGSVLENCYSMGSITGELNTGGLIGYFDSDTEVLNCYAAGEVTGDVNPGGLIGYGSGTAINSYWDTDKSDQVTSAGGEGRTTAEMTYPRAQNTYEDWDFLYRWGKDSDYTINGYPFLRGVTLRISNRDFGGGDGTSSDPWQIETAEHLNNIRNYVGSEHEPYWFVQTSNIELGIPPWNDYEGWVPIGSPQDGIFQGSYDGDFHTINGLFIFRPNYWDPWYQGLFGFVNNSYISNVGVTNVNVSGSQYYTGSLVGCMSGSILEGSSIINCYSTGNVSGISYVGGLIGKKSGESSIIDNCFSECTVSGGSHIGGLVGSSYGCDNDTTMNSYSTGNVSGTGDFIGGLMGSSIHLSTIENCYSTGSVNGNQYIGGLVGYNENSSISHSSSNSNVTGASQYVGGLVGRNDYYSSIEHSHSLGNVIGHWYVGGLVGFNKLNSSINYCFSNSTVTGEMRVGGLVGSNERSPINNSYSNGAVFGDQRVGGIAGSNYNDLPATGATIINSYFTGNIAGSDYVGGITGSNTSGAIIENSYTSGSVTGTGNHVGGLVGQNTANVINSFWDVEASGQGSSAGGEDKTTAEMLLESTYSGWDFEETWELSEFNPYMRKYYPNLQWQKKRDHNKIKHAHAHYFREREWQWRSFPRLAHQDCYTYTTDTLLIQLAGEVITVQGQDEQGVELTMTWNDLENVWYGETISFNSVKGYKLQFDNSDEHFLFVEAPRIDLETWITLAPSPVNGRRENWIGYFIPATQCIFDAFGSEVMDQLEEIRTDEWGMYKQPDGSWRYRYGQEPLYTVGQVAYGKMYSVVTAVEEPIVFQWNVPTEWIPPERQESFPRAQYFSYNEGPDYESFFVDEIEDDEDVLEVAVFAGDTCVGASVFLGSYPLEILAYTNSSHANEEISFTIHRDGQRGEAIRIYKPQVMDNETGDYSSRVIRPLRQRYTVVLLGAGEEETEPIVKPEILLLQNYPNPIFFTETARSNLTEIPFYVSEEREASLTIFNIRGQRVKTLFSGTVEAGKHSIGWNGLNEYNRKVGSGVYLYRLESGDKVITRKMLLVR